MTVIEWKGVQNLTDPDFPHPGDHVHLGLGAVVDAKHGVNIMRLIDPEVTVPILYDD